MYFLGLFHKNARLNKTGQFVVDISNNTIPKWTTVVSGRRSGELMRLLALGLTGTRYTARLPFDVQRLVKASESYLHMETLIVQHAGTDGKTRREKSGINIIRID